MGQCLLHLFVSLNVILLWALCCSSALRTSPFGSTVSRSNVESLDMSSIEVHLQKVNKPAVKSIRSSDGDTIDCVPRSKQLAFDHPLLKDHKLQEAPSTVPHQSESHTGHPSGQASQLWHKSGECPNATIPVRRTTIDDILRTGSSPELYGHKFYGAPQVVEGVEHEHSYGYADGEQAYYGTQAIFSKWDPNVELSNEFSLAQWWVIAGSGSELNTIEAGWQVFPEQYGDNNPRLFVYWTTDGYAVTGCYNLVCSGFVQTSNNVMVGGTISPVSTIDGQQLELTLLVLKDSGTGNWWLQFNGESVGYWPHSLFTHLNDSATMLEWGGEIINREQNGQHTTTQMGSGEFAEAGLDKAAYIRNLQWVDAENTLQNISGLQTVAENSTCYDIKAFDNDAAWGTYFFFGGPGRNANCP